MDSGRLPVVLLTGFLGSGKTTLLNAWLRAPELSNAAVVVNEFGDVGIDHALIASSSDNTIELTTGCMCCTVRGDLINTLRELFLKRSRGEVRAFDRLVIETTGLADPIPIIQALMTFPVATRYRLQRVLTVVDAVQGASNIDKKPEAFKQVAVADEIIISKLDLASEEGVGALMNKVRAINLGATKQFSSSGNVPPPFGFEASDIYSPASKSADVRRWLNAEAYSERHEHSDDHKDAGRHDTKIGSFCLEYHEPLEWEHVANWLDALVVAHGEDLLRVKGIFDIAGRDAPIVVQAVQKLFHAPT
ncbi:MAG: CobW family GTP-binding protein, partial [Candidatus Binatia bacterium]